MTNDLMAPRLRQRAVVRYSPGGMAGAGTRRDDSARSEQAEGAMGTVLVIDPDPAAGNAPGLAATAAAHLAERIGFVAGAIALSSDEGLIAEIGGRPLDLVVLVVGAQSASEQADWESSTWSIPAMLTEAYHSKGIDVMVVSAGASVAALTGCLEHGAVAAFELGAMRDVLLGLVAEPEWIGAAPIEGAEPSRPAPRCRRASQADRRRAPSPVPPDHRAFPSDHRQRVGRLPGHGPLPHQIRPPQTGCPVTVGRRRPGHEPGPATEPGQRHLRHRWLGRP